MALVSTCFNLCNHSEEEKEAVQEINETEESSCWHAKKWPLSAIANTDWRLDLAAFPTFTAYCGHVEMTVEMFSLAGGRTDHNLQTGQTI